MRTSNGGVHEVVRLSILFGFFHALFFGDSVKAASPHLDFTRVYSERLIETNLNDMYLISLLPAIIGPTSIPKILHYS
jgi:hypothetical protein